MGILKLKGTVCGICFYCIDGVYYARAKSSLSGERVKTDPAFGETMKYANRMGIASKISSILYRQIVPVHERSRERYREVVGMVMRELDAALRWQGLNHEDRKTQRCTKVNKKLHNYRESKCIYKKLSYRKARLSLSFTAITACPCNCCTFWNNRSRSDTEGEKSAEYLASIYASSSIFNKRLSSPVFKGKACSTTVVQRRQFFFNTARA